MLSYYPYYSDEVQKGPGVYLSDAIVEIVKPDTGPDLAIQTLEFIQDSSLMSVQIHTKLYIMVFFLGKQTWYSLYQGLGTSVCVS